MLIRYENKRFNTESIRLIEIAQDIIQEYQVEGFTLTLRQLYYQFVARDYIENTVKSYKKLGNLINNARLAGYISWEAIEDRTRNLQSVSTWSGPRGIMNSVINSYREDKWSLQSIRPEVWIEKEALIGIVERICDELEVPYFACKGYNSQSEQWRAGRRFKEYLSYGQQPVIFHLGDHDPSGIDMTRDNELRLNMFAEGNVEIHRLALNYDQVKKYNPPPNPAKQTDTRFEEYERQFGSSSWELDSLDPKIITKLISDAIYQYRNEALWQETLDRQEDNRDLLREARDKFES